MPPISEAEIKELAAWKGDSPMTSCYLDVDGRRFVRQRDLELEVERVVRRAAPLAQGNPSVEADLQRIVDHVRHGVNRARVRGLAIFSSAAAGFWRVIPLPVTVPSRVVVSSSPAVGPLEAVLQDHQAVGVLLVDRHRARLVVIEWDEIAADLVLEELPAHADDEPGERDRGDGRAFLDTRTGAHLRHAASSARAEASRLGVARLMVGGPVELLPSVEHELHAELRDRLCGRVTVAVTAPAEEVRRAASPLAIEAERQRELRLVERLRDDVAAGGKAVAGLGPTLEVIGDARADRLLVSHGYAEPGWRCGPCGRLAAVGRQCATCGEEMTEVVDVVAEAVDDALERGARVDVCVDNADLDVIGRIGALLRY